MSDEIKVDGRRILRNGSVAFCAWEPRYGGSHDPKRCRTSVYGPRVSDWQCQRRPAREIHGFGLCEQHAREVEIRLGLRDPPPRKETKWEREMRRDRLWGAVMDAARLVVNGGSIEDLRAALEAYDNRT